MIEWCNNNQGFIMALLTFVYVATTIFIWLSNKKTNKIALKQLDEIKTERLTREQPFIIIEQPKFIINKPRFFYTPPEDEYSFLSRYALTVQVHNIMDYPALFVDIIGALVIKKDGKEVFLKSPTRRFNVLVNDNKDVNLSFTGDEEAFVFESLREKEADKLPIIELVVYYKSATGGYFKAIHSYYIIPDEKKDAVIRDWHGMIIQAPTKYQETLSLLRKITRRSPQWGNLFQEIKDDFHNSLNNESDDLVSLQLRDIPEKYSLKQIDEDTYNKRKVSYGKYIGTSPTHIPPCLANQKQQSEEDEVALIHK